jgi:hypothetical protein
MRALAIMMKDVETQAIMCRLANDYEVLAQRAGFCREGEGRSTRQW